MKYPKWYKGSDSLLFRWLAAWKRPILKYVKHSNIFCTLTCTGQMKLMYEGREEADRFLLVLGVPWCDGKQVCHFNMCSTALWVFLGALHVEGVAESLESFAEKISCWGHSREL